MEITRICIFDAVFYVTLVLNIFGKLGTCEDNFYLTMIFAACTFE